MEFKPTKQMPFSPQQAEWYERARANLSSKRLQQLLFELTDIHSPTGATRDAADYLQRRMETIGLRTSTHDNSAISRSVMGERRGTGGGASLLLYAPIDTHLDRTREEEILSGPGQQADLQPHATQIDDWVFGLGASNPKGMIATHIEVATAVLEAGVPLKGNLLVGSADGGMPVDIKARHSGMSNGVINLLNRGMYLPALSRFLRWKPGRTGRVASHRKRCQIRCRDGRCRQRVETGASRIR